LFTSLATVTEVKTLSGMHSSAADLPLREHLTALSACRRCKDMVGPVVTGHPVASPVLLIGQAPGTREGAAAKPFAWTAGKTLFRWFTRIGMEEVYFRERVYMAAVCRCFPGKAPGGGDRVPNAIEIGNCSSWLAAEMALLQPRLIIPVGKLAIQQMMEVRKLADVIGQEHRVRLFGVTCDAIPLPHPSGASTWHRTQPGMDLLRRALTRIANHDAWHDIVPGPQSVVP
jgi:uracil-DNA glycosylase